jgi:hypothetical protein
VAIFAVTDMPKFGALDVLLAMLRGRDEMSGKTTILFNPDGSLYKFFHLHNADILC